MHLTRNQAYLYGYRGFESLPLRHKISRIKTPLRFSVAIGCLLFEGVLVECWRRALLCRPGGPLLVFKHS
jgi:hypothetical protein